MKEKQTFMLQIGEAIVSLDVFEKMFFCDLPTCKGVCCIDGDSGAPLEDNELAEIEKSFPIIKKYLSPEFLKIIEEKGLYEKDSDGDWVTPCFNQKECAYIIKDNSIAKCAFEKAYLKGEIDFIKPVSCHLYPIRITEYEKFIAVNYEKRDICQSARIKGFNEKIPVYKFLKQPLVRKFGEEWYKQIELADDEVAKL